MFIQLSLVYTGNVSISASVQVLFRKKMNASDARAPGGGLPYETDGDARRKF